MPNSSPVRFLSRRSFLKQTVAAGMASARWNARGASTSPRLGHGAFCYRVVPGWGVLDPSTPVQNCHGIVCDREGHIILLTDHTANNVIVYDKAGKLVGKWGNAFPGAHGLSLLTEGSREVLFITCLKTHRVVKTTLSGEILEEWRWPEATGKYAKESDFRPSWTLHHPDGSFFILDGYGRDYITHHGPDGRFLKIFGGAEGGIRHWGPHGGLCESTQGTSTLWIAMSDQQHLLQLSVDGQELARIEMPGGNPRQIRKRGDHYFVAHLGDRWPQERNSRGFVSVVDSAGRVVSNVGGVAPEYTNEGKLLTMAHEGEVFFHPHDLVIDAEESVYVAQFASQNTYPIKLERV